MSPFYPWHRSKSLAWKATLIALALGPAIGRAQATTIHTDSLLRTVLSEDSLPSLSVAVARSGKVVYAHTVGKADLELTVSATPNTRYPIGSVSKALTAVAALRLVDAGKLARSDDVRHHCITFPDKGTTITINQLMAHTGGIRHYDYSRFDEDYLNKKRFATLDDALSKFAADSLRHLPGSRYLYSSWGYVLLGCALEGAAAKSYANLLEELVTTPAGMTATRLDDVSLIIPNRSRSYYRPNAGGLINAGLFDASDRYPAGGVLSTPSDLARLGMELLDGRLLPDSLLTVMWHEASLDSGTSTGHGLGWDVDSTGMEVWVGGTSVGSTAFLYINRSTKVVVAFTTNMAIWNRDRLALARLIMERFVRG